MKTLLRPEGLVQSPAFTHVAIVPPGMTTIYVGGQNAVTADGTLVGEGDIAEQTRKTMANVRTALARFEEKEIETLPVLDSPTEHKVMGYLTEQYALRRYNQALERRRSADLGERDLFSIAEPPR